MIDIGQPIEQSWNRTELHLFRPFHASTWFALGFTAWLASFLNGGAGGGSFQVPSNISINPILDEAGKKIREGISSPWNALCTQALGWGLPAWLGILAGLFLLAALLYLLFTWLGCRGRFMFLDNVLHNRAEVVRPWHEFRPQGNSLFQLHAGIGIAALSVFFLLLAGALVSCWPDIVARKMRSFYTYIPWILVFVGFFLGWLPVAIGLFFLKDFGVPLMYRRRCSAWEACLLLSRLGRERCADFLLYLVVRIVLAIVLVFTAFIASCLTCCLGFIPYLGTVITLPLWVFRQSFVLDCLAQISPEDQLWPPAAPPPVPPSVS